MNVNSGIYQITNTVNSKRYVGSAVNLHARLGGHRRHLNRGTHHNAHLQSAWRKYGAAAFAFRVLLICAKEDLYFFEQRCIDAFDVVSNGYNHSPTAGTVLGIKRTPEYIQRMSAGKRGKLQTEKTKAARRATMNRPDVRAKLSASCKAAIRKPKTAEHVRNVGLAQIGKVVSAETRAKLRAFNLGKKRGPHSEETKLKISLAQVGRSKPNTQSAEQRRVAGLKAWITRRAR